MKMFGPKSLSYYLFYISRLATLGSIVLIAFILISLGVDNYEIVNSQFQIAIPLFKEVYIKGFYQSNIIVTITITMLFFTIFFYMLSNVLKTFKADKIFSEKAVKQLNYFALLNILIGPIVYLIIHFIIMNKSGFRDIHNLLLSLLLGIFVLFTSAVFRAGYTVQNENDLTI